MHPALEVPGGVILKARAKPELSVSQWKFRSGGEDTPS